MLFQTIPVKAREARESAAYYVINVLNVNRVCPEKTISYFSMRISVEGNQFLTCISSLETLLNIGTSVLPEECSSGIT